MKKVIFILSMVALASCTNMYEDWEGEFQTEDVEIKPFLMDCCKIAYETHKWLSEEQLCHTEEQLCAWEFVPDVIRSKYEGGGVLSVEEMETAISYMETCPSFWDTIAESDAFVNLDLYRQYGMKYFEGESGGLE